MPFESQAQARYMYSQHPKLAAEMSAKTDSIKALPEHVAAPASVSRSAPAQAAPQSISPDRKRMAMQGMVAKYGKA